MAVTSHAQLVQFLQMQFFWKMNQWYFSEKNVINCQKNANWPYSISKSLFLLNKDQCSYGVFATVTGKSKRFRRPTEINQVLFIPTREQLSEDCRSLEQLELLESTTAVLSMPDNYKPRTKALVTGSYKAIQDFVPIFSKRAAPSSEKIRKGQPTFHPFSPSDLKGQRRETKKWAIDKTSNTTAVMLNKLVQVDTDMCSSQLRCVPMHHQEHSLLQPVRYRSRKLYNAKQRLPTTHNERLAVAWTVLLLQSYLACRSFAICSDHMA